MNSDKIILGIDPGTNLLGYGIIAIKSGKPVFVDMGILSMIKEKDHFQKLNTIYDFTCSMIQKHGVHEVAIEAPFFGENVQSMLKLGRAQGVAIAAAIHCKVPITEYAPRKIKLAITGRGNASKEQVAGLLQHQLHFEKIPKNLDATDGLAVALCHFYQFRSPVSPSSVKNWSEFIARNPNRVK